MSKVTVILDVQLEKKITYVSYTLFLVSYKPEVLVASGDAGKHVRKCDNEGKQMLY